MAASMNTFQALALCAALSGAILGLACLGLWRKLGEAVLGHIGAMLMLGALFYLLDAKTLPTGDRPNLLAGSFGMLLSVGLLSATGRLLRPLAPALLSRTLLLQFSLAGLTLLIATLWPITRLQFFWGYGWMYGAQILLCLFSLPATERWHLRRLPLLLSLAVVPSLIAAVQFSGVDGLYLRYLIGLVAVMLATAVLIEVLLTAEDSKQQNLQALEQARARLEEVVGAMAAGANQVAEAGERMSQGAQNLAIRTDQQTERLKTISVTVQSAVGQVQGTAALIGRVDERCSALQGEAAAGEQMVQRAVGSIEQISHNTGEMREALTLIESIAFQTNILALNAAIEAARAGSAGRGFAVVAGEVRALSGRTSEAAQHVRQLIGRAAEQAEQGVNQVQQMRGQLSAILSDVNDIAQQTQRLASDAQRQSVELGQTMGELNELAALTDSNAELVAESVMTADTMNASAGQLRSLIASLGQPEAGADAVAKPAAEATASGSPGAATGTGSGVDFF